MKLWDWLWHGRIVLDMPDETTPSKPEEFTGTGTGNGGANHANDCHTTLVIRTASRMGLLSLAGTLILAGALITGFKPKGGGGGEVQKDLALVVLGSLIVIPTSVLNGLFGLVGKTTSKDAGPAGTEADPTKTQIVNKPADPVPTVEAGDA